METTHPKRDFLLGLLFFGTIVLLIYATVALTGFSFRERTFLDVWFPSASGLQEGDAVLVSGRATGSVRAVDFFPDRAEDRRIRVRLELVEPIPLHRDCAIAINEFTLLGGRVVEIYPGSAAEPLLPDGTEILGAVGPSALASLGAIATESREDLRAILRNLRQSTADLAQGKGVLGALVADEKLLADLRRLVADTLELADELRAGRGTLGLLLHDAETRERFASFLADAATGARDLREIAEDLRGGRGFLGALLYDEAISAEGRELIANLEAASDGLARLVEGARSGEGLVGRLLTDEDLAREAEAFVHDVSEVARRLREGEGSLGRLMAEEDAYQELLDALQSLNARLEDAREAQPVSSFAGLLFGAF